MKWLRRRKDKVESVWISPNYTAEQRADALIPLGGCVVIVNHPYQRCAYSGAGNCWCGRHEEHNVHDGVSWPEDGGE